MKATLESYFFNADLHYDYGNIEIPMPISAAVENANRNIIIITFDIDLDGTTPPDPSVFTTHGITDDYQPNNVVIAGNEVSITLDGLVIYGDVITIDYIVPFTDGIHTTDGGYCESFTDFPVTNNVCIDVLNFDGINDIVIFSSVPVITGDKIITIHSYLTQESGYGTASVGEGILALIPGALAHDYLLITLRDNQFRIYVTDNDNVSNKYFLLTGLGNQYLEIIITKTTSSVISVEINGNIIALNNIDALGMGAQWKQIGQVAGGDLLDDCYLWDISIENAGVETHHWRGYPDGALSSAWEDQIGSIDGTVFGTPTGIEICPP